MVNGDLGYNLDSNNYENGEGFLYSFSEIAESVPIFMAPGNHDTGVKGGYSLY